MHLVRGDTELDPAFLGGSLGKPDTRERGNRENSGWDAAALPPPRITTAKLRVGICQSVRRWLGRLH